MWARLKRFDIHPKAIEGVHQKTLIGALLTIVTAVIVVVLLASEISSFLKIEAVSRMVVDKSANLESVHVSFDVEFPALACSRITFSQEVTRGSLHSFEPAAVSKREIDSSGKSGCQISGSFLTDKAMGHFKFGVESSTAENPADFTHVINNIAFLPTDGLLVSEEKLPGIIPGFNQSLTAVPLSVGAFQYSLQIVPTQYKELYGELSYINQYSILEKEYTYQQLEMGAFSELAGKKFSGVAFTYGFYPVMLYMEERRERIVDFISSLFGIVGGVITVLTLVEGFLHHSSKAFIGKKD